jgi:hypothetical protein
MGFWGEVFNAFNRPAKEKGKAYAALIFLGLVGWHEFYLEKTFRGMLYILGFILLMLGQIGNIVRIVFGTTIIWRLPIGPLAYIGCAMLAVFFLFDLFTLGKQVDKWNAENANRVTRAAGKVAGNVISIPLKNAVEEYNGIVAGLQNSLAVFNDKKSQVEPLLEELQQARKDAFSAVSRMEQLLRNIRFKETEVNDMCLVKWGIYRKLSVKSFPVIIRFSTGFRKPWISPNKKWPTRLMPQWDGRRPLNQTRVNFLP